MAALVTAAAMFLVAGSVLIVPAFPVPIAYWAPALVGAATAFAGLFGLWLDHGQRRLSGALILGAAMIWLVASPIVPAPSTTRLLVTYVVPGILALFAAAVLISPDLRRRIIPALRPFTILAMKTNKKQSRARNADA